MTTALRVLLIEDSEDDALLLVRALRQGGYAPDWQRVDTADGLRVALQAGPWDVIISDYQLPQFTALDALAIVKGYDRDTPFIIVSGAIGEDTAVAAMRAGAHDYLMKGQTTRLVPAIAREIDEAAQRRAHRRAEAQRAFLIDLSAALTASLDYETTLANLVGQVVPHLADYCLIDIMDEQGQFQRAAAAHADPDKAELMRALQRDYPPSDHVAAGVVPVMRAGRPVLTEQIDAGQLATAAQDTGHLRLLLALNPRSAIMVPLTIHGRAIGVITLAMTESGRRYTQQDLVLAEEVARRTALAVDNARLYQEARAAWGRAEEAVQVRDQFLSVMAHELRTPLTSLKGYAELFQRRAQRDGLLSQRDQQAVRVIVGQAARLNRMINALLDISRIQLGQLSIERQSLDLAALVAQLAEEAEPTLAQHTLALALPDAPLVIAGDALRLEQVVQNLLQNAVKYSPAGGVIQVSVARQGEWASVSVADQGIGIPAAALPQLFQRFYRASNVASHQISGMGIGLYVVHEIVALHGGSVSVESTEGAGSTFTIRLPTADGRRPNATTDGWPPSADDLDTTAPRQWPTEVQ